MNLSQCNCSLKEVLRSMNLWIMDSDGLVTLLDYWSDITKPGMPIVFAARKGGAEKEARGQQKVTRWSGVKSRTSRQLREMFGS